MVCPKAGDFSSIPSSRSQHFLWADFLVTYLSLAVIIKDGRKEWQDEGKSQQVDEEGQEDNCNNTIMVLLLPAMAAAAAAGSSLSQGHVPSALLLKRIAFISSQQEDFPDLS